MSLETEITRVIGGTKDTLKTLITKLGGTVSNELIDQYPGLAGAVTKPDKWDKGVLLDGGALKDVNGKDVHADVKAALDISAANDAKLIIQKNGTEIGAFSANASADKTVDITVPTKASDIGAASSAELEKISTTLANKAPGGFGLGSDSKILTPSDNLDILMQNGWFRYNKDNPPKGTLPTALEHYASLIRVSVSGATCVQEAFDSTDSGSHGIVLRRTIYGIGAGATIYPWEYENPPMELGVEYRTTERCLGRPVYVKAVDCSPLTDGKSVPHGITDLNFIFYAQGTRGASPLPLIYNHNLSDPWSCYISSIDRTNIVLRVGSSAANANSIVILKYTKTID